jgi:16S rRNA (cytosine967-C5)-methyltransferase
MSARIAAAELLSLVLDEKRTLDEAFSRINTFHKLEGRDRAFAAAIARASLRHLGRIDAALGQFLQRPLPDSATLARAILRTGTAQMLFMATPAHAAVSESVTAANETRGGRGFAKLINAVLRKVASLDGAGGAASEDLPPWLRTRWAAAYGPETLAAIADALAQEPPLDVSVKQDAALWAERLGGEVLPTGSIRLPQPTDVSALPGYGEGAWWVQDAAAALPVKLLGDVSGLSVLDLCAAPGGKTLQLAAAGAKVTALDLSDTRLKRVREHLKRTGLKAEVVCADGLKCKPAEPFDAVLLDAPCTATGTLRRHPEAAWLRTPAHIAGFAKRQSALLDAAQALVKPGGLLVYAVCSLEPEEGAANVARLLTQGWTREPAPADIPRELLTPQGDLRTLPCHWAERGGMDGFYGVRLRRA